MTERNVLIHHHPLELMEHRGVGGIGIFAEHFARANHAKWRLVRFCIVDLHSGGVTPEQHAIIGCSFLPHIEDILVIASRVFLGKVESIEVVLLGINLRTVGDIEPHAAEDFFDPPDELGYWVEVTTRTLREIHRDIECILCCKRTYGSTGERMTTLFE